MTLKHIASAAPITSTRSIPKVGERWPPYGQRPNTGGAPWTTGSNWGQYVIYPRDIPPQMVGQAFSGNQILLTTVPVGATTAKLAYAVYPDDGTGSRPAPSSAPLLDGVATGNLIGGATGVITLSWSTATGLWVANNTLVVPTSTRVWCVWVQQGSGTLTTATGVAQNQIALYQPPPSSATLATATLTLHWGSNSNNAMPASGSLGNFLASSPTVVGSNPPWDEWVRSA